MFVDNLNSILFRFNNFVEKNGQKPDPLDVQNWFEHNLKDWQLQYTTWPVNTNAHYCNGFFVVEESSFHIFNFALVYRIIPQDFASKYVVGA